MARGIVRIPLLVAAGLAGLLVLAALLYAAGLGRETVGRYGLRAAGDAAGYAFDCGEFEGEIFSAFACRDFAVSDSAGVFLAAGEIEFAWRFLPILSSELRVTRARISDAELTRIPEGGGEAGDSLLPDWPGMEMEFGALVLDNFMIRIADAPAACLGGTASASIAEPVFSFDADIARCGGEGRFNAQANFSEGRLDLDAEIADDGVLAAIFLGWDGAGRTEIRIAGAGAIEMFSGTLDAAIENGVAASLRISALPAGPEGIARLAATGDISLAEGRAPDWAPANAGAVSLVLGLPPAGGAIVEDGVLAWDDSEIRFALTIDEDERLSGNLGADLGAYSGPIGFQSADFGLTLLGTAALPIAEGNYRFGEFCADRYCAAGLNGTFHFQSNAGDTGFSVQGNAQMPQIADALGSIVGDNPAYDVSGTYAGGGETLHLEGNVNGVQSQLTFAGDLQFGNGTRGTGRLLLALDEGADAGGLIVPERVTIEAAPFAFTPAGDISGALNIASATADASGRFALGAGNDLDVALETTRIDSARLSDATGFAFAAPPSLRLSASGTAETPVVALAAAIPELSISGFAIGGAEWTLNARLGGDVWQGESAFTSGSAAGDLVLNANFSRSPDSPLAVRFADSTIAGAGLSGGLTVPLEGGLPMGNFTLAGTPLAPLAVYVGRPLSAGGSLALDLGAAGGQQTAIVNLSLADAILAEGLMPMDVTGRVTHAFTGGATEAAIALRDGENEIAITAEGVLGAETQFTIAALEGNVAATPIRLTEPFTFRQTQGASSVSPARFDLAGGQAEFEAAQSASELTARIAFAAVPTAPLSEIWGIGATEGTIDGEGNIRLTAGAAEGAVSAAVHDFAFAGLDRELIPADLALRGDWDGRVLSFGGEITGLDDAPAGFTASFPLVRAPGTYDVQFDGGGAIAGQLSATARAERLLAILPLAEHRLTGGISAELALAGTVAGPRLTGRAALEDASYESLELGTRLENIRLEIETLPNLDFSIAGTASDGDAGRLALNGRMALGDGGTPVGEATLTATNAYLVRRDQHSVRAGGEVNLNFPAAAPGRIAANITTSEVRIDLGQPPPPGVEEIEVVEINRPAELGEAAAGGPGMPEFIRTANLDLNLTMPNNVQVSGYGVDSEWRGELHGGGTGGAPELSGQLDLVRGIAQFLGRPFTLNEGRVTPTNAADGGARIRVVGTHARDGLSVRMLIEGAANAPQISWTSTPALPREEIISRLYFGRDSSRLSAYEALQLAELTGALGDFGGTGGVLEFARRTAGLDVLRIESPEEGEGGGPNVTVGKYVTDRVYVGATRDGATSSGMVAVEIEVTPNISVDVETGSDSQRAAGVNWQWDY